MPALPLEYLVVVDPIGLAPTFLGITAGLPRATRRQVALRACLS
jgi:multiple antibiotic resistance protein